MYLFRGIFLVAVLVLSWCCSCRVLSFLTLFDPLQPFRTMGCCSGSKNKRQRKRQPTASKDDDDIIREGKRKIVRENGKIRALTNTQIANLINGENKDETWVRRRYSNKKYTHYQEKNASR